MKNIMNILKITLLFFVVTFWSCMDLEEDPLNKLAPAYFYENPDQCMAALVGATSIIIEDHPDYADGSMRVDLNWDVNFQTNVWNKYWQAISNINPVIKAINDNKLKEFDGDAVKDILGQAYFLRSYCFFQLVRLYGEIPYIDENYPDIVVNKPTPESREPVSTVYDKIEADLLKAVDLIDKTIDLSKPGRPYVWAVRSLLARVYINRATEPLNDAAYYAKARDMADDIIQNSPYQFMDNIQDIFDILKVSANTEYIWQVNSSDDAPQSAGCRSRTRRMECLGRA